MRLPTAHAGYGELLRSNRGFRLLWLGSVASLFGDWFNTMAVFALVEALTGSPLAMGLVLAIKLFGFALLSIPGGLVADRLDRKRLMVGADLLRALIVLGFLFVRDASHMPLLIALLTAQVGLGAVFDPAFRASIPNVCSPRELLTANTLFSATWSALLAVGAAVGGLATAELGLDAVFVIDAATYLLSAACIARVAIPRASHARRAGRILALAARDVADGWRYLLARPAVARMALAKTAWAGGGGALVYLLTQIGELLTPTELALGIGVLFSARGVGTGIGPILARRFFPDARRWSIVIGACVALSGAAYLAVAAVGWSFWILAPIVVAHAASGANWVLSTVILQDRVEDAFRGRVFGTEMVLLMAVEAITTLLAAWLLEIEALSLTGAVVVFASVQLACGALWLAHVPAAERREQATLGVHT